MGKATGPQKAAMLLLALGEDASAAVMKNLTPEELKVLGVEMSMLQGVKKEVFEELFHEFSGKLFEEDDVRTTGEQFLQNLLPNVIGDETASEVFANIEQAKEKIPFKNIKQIDARVLANFIKNEHPQTIAIILVHLGHEKASQVLGMLPEALQFEAVNRIANLETVPPDLVQDVDEVLEKELLSMGKESQQLLGGINKVAEILNFCDRRTGDGILQYMEDYDSELAEKVRKLMFVFEDLVNINEQGVRELLKEIRTEDLVMALKTASEELKGKILKSLSLRAAQIIEEDLTMLGPVRLSDVEAAQQNILNIARRLEKEGKIMMAGRDGGDTLV